MKKKTGMVCGVLLALGVFALTSCDEFFSASWGTAREYDPSKIALNAGNVDKWLDKATGNPDLAKALLTKIKEEVGGATGANKAKLQEAGVTLAITGSGIGTSMLANAGDLIGKLSSDNSSDEVDNITGILGKVQSDFKDNKGLSAANDLAAIVLGGGTEFDASYKAKAQPGDVGQAVLVLALAIAEGTNLNVSNPDSLKLDINGNQELGIKLDDNKAKVIAPDTADPKAIALVAYLNLIKDDPGEKFGSNPITGAIKSAFFM